MKLQLNEMDAYPLLVDVKRPDVNSFILVKESTSNKDQTSLSFLRFMDSLTFIKNGIECFCINWH